MEDLANLTMNELITLAKVAQHKRKKNNEACLKYYHNNIIIAIK